ncbi:hypothetical protein ACN20G_36840 (plasmid) [Streptomyces sp. BI20]|uniref:hypothetical protein n=1 Tax=Streptomyces sp. BI20 TaxID=3403460 RepID=UPI003C72830E
MNIFDNDVANAGFGALVFGAMATVALIAGLKFKLLKSWKTTLLVAVFVLLVTVNSGGLLGELAGVLRLGMNSGGEAAVDTLSGAKLAPNPLRTPVEPASAGGAAIGLCGLTWYGVKAYAAKGKLKEAKEMILGAVLGVCYGTTLGFMGMVVGVMIPVANNIGYWAFSG